MQTANHHILNFIMFGNHCMWIGEFFREFSTAQKITEINLFVTARQHIQMNIAKKKRTNEANIDNNSKPLLSCRILPRWQTRQTANRSERLSFHSNFQRCMNTFTITQNLHIHLMFDGGKLNDNKIGILEILSARDTLTFCSDAFSGCTVTNCDRQLSPTGPLFNWNDFSTHWF